MAAIDKRGDEMPTTEQAKPAAPGGALRWLAERLLPRGAGGLMVAAYAVILAALISFILGRGDMPDGPYYAVILALSAMLALHVVWNDIQARIGRERGTVLHLLANGALFLIANYLGLTAGGLSFLPFIMFMLAAQAVIDLPGRPAAAYVAAIAGGWLGVIGLRGFDILANAVSISLGLIFAVVLARVLKLAQEQTDRAERLLAELRTANAALEAARERERDLAAAEERVRLARDIHDGLGHHLSVLNVQLQAAGKLVERDPARAREAIALCRAEAQAAMEEVRQSVAAMRRSPLDGRSLPEAVARLVADFDRASPIAASFALAGEPRELDPAAAMTLFRAAQEGLTNAQKHAGAASAAVELSFADGRARLRVRDDGPGAAPAAPAPSSGFGLAGLAERADQLGGRFSAGPDPAGGFLLELEVPL